MIPASKVAKSKVGLTHDSESRKATEDDLTPGRKVSNGSFQ